MRGYFDDERVTQRPRRDTELTLGTGALFGLFFGLVLLCGFCFGLGYAMGHRGTARTVAAKAPTAAPDEEPLQGSAAIPKPSAAETAPAPPLLPGDAGTAPLPITPGNGATTNPAGAQTGPVANAPGGAAPGTASAASSEQVRPALPGAGYPAPTARAGATAQRSCGFALSGAVAGADCRCVESRRRQRVVHGAAPARLLGDGRARSRRWADPRAHWALHKPGRGHPLAQQAARRWVQRRGSAVTPASSPHPLRQAAGDGAADGRR